MRTWLLRLLALRPDRVLARLLGGLLVLGALTALQHWGMARLEPVPGTSVLRPLAAGSEDQGAVVQTYPAAGRVQLADGQARLESPTPQGSVALRVTVPSGAPLAGLRIAAELAASEVRPAAGWSSGAHLRLVGRNADGGLLFARELHLARLVGTRSPFPLRRDVALPTGSVGATLTAELVRASGAFELRGLAVQPLRERLAFRLARAALIAGWILVGGWTVLRLLGALRSPWLATALGLAATVAVALLVLPKAPQYWLLVEAARTVGLERVDPERIGDLGHVAIFTGLALVAVWRVRTLPLWAVVAALALAAPIAEYVQLLADGRTAEPADALRNLLGVALGSGLGLALRRLALAGGALGRRTLP